MELHGLAAAVVAAATAATAAAARLARRVGNTRDAGAASRIWVTCGVAWDVLARHGSDGMSPMAPLDHRDRPDNRISGAVE